jgi:hypothetical protein
VLVAKQLAPRVHYLAADHPAGSQVVDPVEQDLQVLQRREADDCRPARRVRAC